MRFLIVTILLSLANFAMAHSPHISTYNIRQVGGVWVLEGSFAQSSLDVAMIKILGDEKVKSLDEQTYKVEILDLLRKNISLNINGVSVGIGEAGIKLGSHQTDVKFVIEGNLANMKSLEAQIKPLPGIHGHQNVLRFQFNGERERLILDEKNNYKNSIGDAPDVSLAASEDNTLLIVIIFLIAGISVFVIYKVLSKKRPNPA